MPTVTPSIRRRVREGSRTYQRLMREAKAEYDAQVAAWNLMPNRRLRDGCWLLRADGSMRGVATRFRRLAA